MPGAGNIVDVQHHLIPPVLREHSARNPDSEFARTMGTKGDLASDVAQRIAELDQAGVDVATLSIARSDPALTDPGQVTELLARCNDELVAVAVDNPGRFNVLLTLPFPHPEECLAELDRIGSHPAVVGAILHCEVAAWTPTRQDLQPVFQRLAELERPVALHPAIFQFGPAEVFEDWMLWASVAPMFETSIAAARIIYSGLLDRVPQLVVVVPHLGGVLPFLTQRLADLSKTGAAEHDALWYMQNRLLFDSCNLFGPALDLTAATVGADRIMFGSDYPARGSVKRNADHIRESNLGDDAKRAILTGTAERYGFARTAL